MFINPFGIIVSIVLFKICQHFKRIPVIGRLPPIFIAGMILIVILEYFQIDIRLYNESASYLTLPLIPATIALGYPIYQHLDLLRKNKRVIYSAFAVATVVAIISTYIAAALCNTSLNVIESILPKSVTAPIAIEISKGNGGIPELTACVVVLTGVFGAVFGHHILKLVRVKSSIAIGLSMGAASHVLGTARCIEKGNEKQVVMSSVALVIVGILTTVVVPLFLYLIETR